MLVVRADAAALVRRASTDPRDLGLLDVVASAGKLAARDDEPETKGVSFAPTEDPTHRKGVSFADASTPTPTESVSAPAARVADPHSIEALFHKMQRMEERLMGRIESLNSRLFPIRAVEMK